MNEIFHQHVYDRAVLPPVNVRGVSVDRLTRETLIEQALALNHGSNAITVMYANIHVLNTSRQDHDLRPILNSADIVYCDGSGVRLGAWLLGHKIPPRMTGADWMEQLCAGARAGEPNSTYWQAGRESPTVRQKH